MASEEFVCVMDATKADGTSNKYYIYRKGSSYYINGPNERRYSCHDSVANIESVKREISIVFNATVTNVITKALLGTKS
jgi:hypothetical protein